MTLTFARRLERRGAVRRLGATSWREGGGSCCRQVRAASERLCRVARLTLLRFRTRVVVRGHPPSGEPFSASKYIVPMRLYFFSAPQTFNL